MKSIVFPAPSQTLSDDDLKFCVQQIRAGELVIFPTDTVYGLACHAFHPISIGNIYTLKGRSYTKPLPLLLANEEQLLLVADNILPEARKLMKVFWPGPLTLVFKTAPLALHATRGKDTVAVRIPDHGVARQILKELDFPLATTSANPSGAESSRSFEDAQASFLDQVSILVDGGMCPTAIESTVVDVTHYPFNVLRVGALSKQQIANVLS